MDLSRVIAHWPSRFATPLSRRTALHWLTRRETVALVLMAGVASPRAAAAQIHEGGHCCMYSTNVDGTPLWRVCAPECAPAPEGMTLLDVTVERCEVCPPYPPSS